MRKLLFLLLVILACGVQPASGNTKKQVDRILVLLLDSSASVDTEEWKLQLSGTANAFLHPTVVSHLTGQGEESTAVIAVEWSGRREQRILASWAEIRNASDGERFAQELQYSVRRFGRLEGISKGTTSIGSAMEFAITLIDSSHYHAPHMIIDISSDGVENEGGRGAPIPLARDRAMTHGITVNALIVASQNQKGPSHAELAEFYSAHVIVGDNAFVKSADGFRDYHEAIRQKLIHELFLASR